MMNETKATETKGDGMKQAKVTIVEDVRAGMNILEAGAYTVEMPEDYDPALVTGEDIIMDESVRVVNESHKETVDVFGDSLEVNWDGNVWISPVNGQQHSSSRAAMETELRAYFRSSGDDPDEPAFAEQIEGYLDGM